MPAVILYGAPGAGKDTVTEALTGLDPDYRIYRRLKVGAGRTAGYRMTTLSHVDALRGAGDVLWVNRRYGALYVVDRPSLAEMSRVCNPVLHLGQTEAVGAITAAIPALQWVVVWLWCPRGIAVERIAERGTGDITDRLQAWEETKPLPEADLSINTAEVCPVDAAARIHSQVNTLRC